MPDYSETMCRVCLQDYREDFESVYVDHETKSELSPIGLLYEELFQLTVCRLGFIQSKGVHRPNLTFSYKVAAFRIFYNISQDLVIFENKLIIWCTLVR